ncbi:MAG: membrane dipeptidase, partial [Pedobacter sp.]
MKKITMLLASTFISLISFAQNSASIHQKAIVVDTHGDILFNQIKSGIDIGKLQSTGNFDLVRAKKGGLDVQVFSIWCDEKGGYDV